MTATANGFSAEMTEAKAKALARHPSVVLVEENGYVEVSASRSAGDIIWNLDRIDQRGPVTEGDDVYNFCETGSGVVAYVVDSGIRRTHQEFRRSDGSSRVLDGVCFADGCQNNGTTPCNGDVDNYQGGHGTSVASVLGGRQVGVASEVELVPVQIIACDGSGTIERLNWGLDWIRSVNNPHRDRRPAVVNMSNGIFYLQGYPCEPTATTETSCTDGIDNDCDGFTDGEDPDCGGTCPSESTLLGCQARFLEHVINGLVLTDYDLESGRPEWDGIPVIVSANNQNQEHHHTTPPRLAYSNASNYGSPGHVISVGGTTRTDGRWECPVFAGETCPLGPRSDGSSATQGSNFGPTVDIWAPAHEIESAHILSDTAYRTAPETRSGTSFAAPLVAGVVARLLQAQPTLTPDQVWDELRTTASAAASAIDPVTGNRMIIYRDGAGCP